MKEEETKKAMDKKQFLRSKLGDLIRWAYKASFLNVFDYKNGKTTLNEKSKAEIDNIINKFTK